MLDERGKSKIIWWLAGLLVMIGGGWTAFIQTAVIGHGQDIVKAETKIEGWESVKKSVERAAARVDESADIIFESNDRLMQHLVDCDLRVRDHVNECDDWRNQHEKEHEKNPGE